MMFCYGDEHRGADSFSIRDSSELFLFRHLVTAGRDTAMVHLKPETMMTMLRDDRLHAPFEEMALETVVRWVEHDPTARCHLVPELLQSLRLGYLAPSTLSEVSTTKKS